MATIGIVSPRGLWGLSPFDREPRGNTDGGAIAFFGFTGKVDMAVTSPPNELHCGITARPHLRGQSPLDGEPRGHTGGGAIAFFGFIGKVDMAATSPPIEQHCGITARPELRGQSPQAAAVVAAVLAGATWQLSES
jgi:hypothetical protein